VAGDGHDVDGRVRRFGGEQVELLALVVDETDVDLDAGFGFELLLEASGTKLVVGPDIDLAALRIGLRR
jgi:hypothetical protein